LKTKKLLILYKPESLQLEYRRGASLD
jgi:hypothetical protein